MPQQYPFSAVLGCDPASPDGLDDMGLALVLTAISPAIGGVLVRGQKGTAKSTTVRALAAVLPPVAVREGDRFSTDPADAGDVGPDSEATRDAAVQERPVRLVELPVGATEDRVLGSLHLGKALSRGEVEFEPGLLARAHRGLLYVDEVNLLHDHLVDLVLDAAATGNVSVERDGVSLSHRARFVLVGTMNPEEGELRPQLLDRFGLTVEVAAPTDPALRVEVVQRRLAYDADPDGFTAAWQQPQDDLRARVEHARAALGDVVLSRAALLKISEVCAAFEVDGLRADIVLTRTALAHAAWHGHDRVTLADIRAAALLALPHRRRRNPFDAPGLDEALLDQVLGDEEPEPDPPGGGEDGDSEGSSEDDGVSTSSTSDEAGASDDEAGLSDDDLVSTSSTGGHEEDGVSTSSTSDETGSTSDSDDDLVSTSSTSEQQRSTSGAGTPQRADAPFRPRLLSVDGVGEGAPGRRSRARSRSGRRVGAQPGDSGSLHLVETLRAAADRLAARRTGAAAPRPGQVRLEPADLRTAVREGRESNLLVFVVDASGSMAARKRMKQVKTAVLSLLTDAYRRRDRVALVTFRGTGAEVALPPTRSVEVAAALLDDLPTGGRTPLAEGLLEAASLVRREHLRDPRVRPLLVVVTDGRATAGSDAVGRSRSAADHLAAGGVPTVVVDSESGPLRLGLARVLAGHLRAEHLPVEHLDAAALTGAAGKVA